MENGDYLSVKKVDNGYVFELNAYSCDKVKQRKCVVAHSNEEAVEEFSKLVGTVDVAVKE